MSLFVFDTAGDQGLHKSNEIKNAPVINRSKNSLLNETNCNKVLKTVDEKEDDGAYRSDEDYLGLPPPSVDLSALICDTLAKTATTRGKINQALDDVTEKVDAALEKAKSEPRKQRRRVFDLDHSDFNTLTGKFDDEKLVMTDPSKELTNSILKPGFEQLKAQPKLSNYALRKKNRIERAKTKGSSWYNLPATEVTDEVKNELKILQMRSVLDPKHFYKKNDLKVLPKYFQIGTVLPSPLDYYNERDTRKTKRHTLVDELLADTEFQTYNKRKFNETMARRSKYAQRKITKKMKKLKKQK